MPGFKDFDKEFAYFGQDQYPAYVGPEPHPGAWQDDSDYITRYQTALTWLASNLNKPSWDPQGIDGHAGPNTLAAVTAFQTDAQISPADGKVGSYTASNIDTLLNDSGVPGPVPDPLPSPMPPIPPGPSPQPSPGPSPTPTPGATINIATVVASLKQAATEMGYSLDDQLASLMIGQLRGAEGSYPGVNSSLGGTNNYGATQVTKTLQSAKQGQTGWGGFAHKDSDPNSGSYLGWYYIAPSPLEGARHWLKDNWWGKALLSQNPQDATSYSTILYVGRYFGGVHPGDPNHDPSSDAGQQNIADYASAISRGQASGSELAASPSIDPSTITVSPSSFATLDKRGITQDLFQKAASGGMGSAWSYLLPPDWNTFQSQNGVVWFGSAPSPSPSGSKKGLIVAAVAAVGLILAFFGLSHKG